MTQKQFDSLEPGDVVRGKNLRSDNVILAAKNACGDYSLVGGGYCILPERWTLVRRAKRKKKYAPQSPIIDEADAVLAKYQAKVLKLVKRWRETWGRKSKLECADELEAAFNRKEDK
jgi:hypothetical protein